MGWDSGSQEKAENSASVHNGCKFRELLSFGTYIARSSCSPCSGWTTKAQKLTLTVVPVETGRETMPECSALLMVSRASDVVIAAGKAGFTDGPGASSGATSRSVRGRAFVAPETET